MKNSETFNRLFLRFLNGQSTSDELQQLFDHFGTADESQLRSLINEELESQPENDPDHEAKLHQLFEGITSRIDETEVTRQKGIVKILRIAASLAAILLLATGYWWIQSRPVEIKTAYAAYGKRLEIQLPDGSKAWLNSGSSIQYPLVFSSGKRIITLKEGEVFFDVFHNASLPFIIHSNHADVTVLGTSFEVSSFSREKAIRITVKSGKVGISQPGLKRSATFLLTGDQANIDQVTHNIRLAKVDTSDIAAWLNGRLIFENRPLKEVMQSLERKYNVHIQIENEKLLTKKTTMRLNNQPLIDILAAISFSNHFNYQIVNEQLIIVK